MVVLEHALTSFRKGNPMKRYLLLCVLALASAGCVVTMANGDQYDCVEVVIHGVVSWSCTYLGNVTQ
jgi:uncharacterized membrane protein YjjP (DUF1212 family)